MTMTCLTPCNTVRTAMLLLLLLPNLKTPLLLLMLQQQNGIRNLFAANALLHWRRPFSAATSLFHNALPCCSCWAISPNKCRVPWNPTGGYLKCEGYLKRGGPCQYD